ncbi:hypothetical protein [Ureibacillus aquaedulcis]|uniref:Uncharacterized protein n=1 Tax=Ureibacillus aquaedulcis TaxID=3058421 RepID=A0ABT8GKT4_9BACL|nr:hypothetical protein [Ureibacillus sp. BA0131]MDN4492023.1 hypothetical protein [Ureibacillus sp. BA0131]
MRVSSFLLNNSNFEERKRIMQRKEANDAYKKNALYTQAKKNPMLKVLEDLLSGKTEKELFEKDQDLNEASENVLSPSPKIKEDHSLFTDSPREDKDRETLTSEIVLPSAAELASDHDENINRIPHGQFDFIVSELMAKPTDRDKIYKSLEDMVFEKTYTKAVSSYTYQMQMAQNEFRLEQSLFSLTA